MVSVMGSCSVVAAITTTGCVLCTSQPQEWLLYDDTPPIIIGGVSYVTTLSIVIVCILNTCAVHHCLLLISILAPALCYQPTGA